MPDQVRKLEDLRHRISLPDPDEVMGLAARRSVVYPLTGDLSCSPGSADRVVSLWRRFLARLHDSGAPECMRREWLYFSCRNCPPAGYATGNRTRPCHLYHLCPFCYARSVQGVLKDALRCARSAERGERSGLALVGFRGTGAVTVDESPAGFSGVIDRSLSWRRETQRSLGALGSYFALTLSPCRGRGRWSAASRFVAVVTAERARAVGGVYSGGGKFHVAPLARGVRARRFAVLVSRALSYPRGLILGDPARVAAWLDARARHRLAASFGGFRVRGA